MFGILSAKPYFYPTIARQISMQCCLTLYHMFCVLQCSNATPVHYNKTMLRRYCIMCNGRCRSETNAQRRVTPYDVPRVILQTVGGGGGKEEGGEVTTGVTEECQVVRWMY